ncbi:hypothetical protein D3C72_862690 [compost metagenome]
MLSVMDLIPMNAVQRWCWHQLKQSRQEVMEPGAWLLKIAVGLVVSPEMQPYYRSQFVLKWWILWER